MGHKVIVVSDSHGRESLLYSIVQRELPFDCLIHCGDGVEDISDSNFPTQVRLLRVKGNMDRSYVNEMERTVITEICSRTVMITHGDLYGVNSGFGPILREGRRIDADIVFFGHTHEKMILEGKPALFNPGPANRGHYGVVTIGQQTNFTHKEI